MMSKTRLRPTSDDGWWFVDIQLLQLPRVHQLKIVILVEVSMNLWSQHISMPNLNGLKCFPCSDSVDLAAIFHSKLTAISRLLQFLTFQIHQTENTFNAAHLYVQCKTLRHERSGFAVVVVLIYVCVCVEYRNGCRVNNRMRTARSDAVGWEENWLTEEVKRTSEKETGPLFGRRVVSENNEKHVEPTYSRKET